MSNEPITARAVSPPVAAPKPVRRVGGAADFDAAAQRERGRAALAVGSATAALAVMVLGSLGYVAVVAARRSILSPPSRVAFPGWLAGPLGPLASWFHPTDGTRKILLTGLVGLMYACYLVVLASSRRLRPAPAIAAVVAIELIFFLSPPLSLTDVFNYINYGRMEIVHGLNPYTTIPAIGAHRDLGFQLSNWHQLLSPYGPLFTIFTFALVPLGVAASFWALKATLLAASLASLWLVWRCAELLGRDPLRAMLFVGLNPLVLVWGLGGDHNDFLMVFCILLAVYLLLVASARRHSGDEVVAAGDGVGTVAGAAGPASRGRRLLALLDGAPRPLGASEPGPARELSAGFLLVAAVAIKASAGLLLPIILLGAPRRLRLLGGMIIGAVVLGGASLYAFGPHLPNLAQQSTLVTLVGLPNVIGSILGFGGVTETMKLLLSLTLVLAVLAACFWVWRTRDWIAAAGYATLALLLTLSWTLPWYVLWLLPFAALVRGRALRVAALLASLYLMLAWVPLMTNLIHSIGFKPSLTQLGAERQVKTARLLH